MKISTEGSGSVIDGIDKRMLRRILIIAASQLTPVQRGAVLGGFEKVMRGLDGKPDRLGRVHDFEWARARGPEEIFARLMSSYLPDNKPLRALYQKRNGAHRTR